MLSARRCQYENPNLPKYIVPYEDAAQVEHELNQCRRELATAKAEAEKWEKLHDQDTEHLASLQKRDNYGPMETLNETAMRLSRELAEARMTIDDVCRVIAKEHEGPRLAAMRIVDELAEARKMVRDMEGGVRETGFELYEARKQRDTLLEAVCRLKSELETVRSEHLAMTTRWREADEQIVSSEAAFSKFRDSISRALDAANTPTHHPDIGAPARKPMMSTERIEALAKQRDTLAEAFREWPRLREWLEMSEFIRGYMSNESEAFDAMNKALAAVKGGSHE
jgi:chromosome segregation ATPase